MADCQGGNDLSSAHAQSECPQENGETQLNTIVNTLGKQLQVFGKATQSIKTLAEAVAVLRTDVKDMKRRQRAGDDGPPAKQAKIISLGEYEDFPEVAENSPIMEESPWLAGERLSQLEQQGEEGSANINCDTENFNENNLDQFMEKTDEGNEDFDELEQYFQSVEDTGPEVNEQLARITDLALRGGDPKQDLEKLEAYKKEYKRPSNVMNLQVPKIDDGIWRDLKPFIKSQDYLLQKSLTSYNFLLVPIIQALEALKTGKPEFREKAQEKVMDAFKILCLLVKSTNTTRVEKLKKDIMHKYRGVCNNTASATKLFGDNLQESLKNFEGSKITITKSRSFFRETTCNKPQSKIPKSNKTISTEAIRQTSVQQSIQQQQPQQLQQQLPSQSEEAPPRSSTSKEIERVHFNSESVTESRGGQYTGCTHSTNLANTELVAKSTASDFRTMLQTTTGTNNSLPTTQTARKAPISQNDSSSFSHIWDALKKRGVPKQAREIILKSWRKSTKAQYDVYIRKWIQFCGKDIDPIQPTINDVLKFLSELFHKGIQYRTLGLAKSAISVFLKICNNIDINKSDEISRFMRGAFLERPALPRYKTTWDVNIVLEHLASLDVSSLLQLSCKLCMLFLLLTAQRCQTLHLIELADIKFLDEMVTIFPNHLLKQTKPGKHLEVIQLKAYTKNNCLCIVQTLKEYLDRTKALRNSKKLLISTMKPHQAVSKSTVSRWVKLTMARAGIDKSFGPHSTRSASTSKAQLHGIPLEEIVKTAGWANAKVFGKYYNKRIEKNNTKFQDAILGH